MGEAVANVARRINATMENGLDTLDLSNCNLISFPDGVLKMIRSYADQIHIISLANNKLKSLSGKFFTMFTQLTAPPAYDVVYVGYAAGMSESLALWDSPTLTSARQNLDLQGNTLTKLPEAAGEMQHLISINLSNNNLNAFPEQLTNVPTLQNINLSGNQISDVSWEGVCAMSSLNMVDLRSNPLTSSPQTSPSFTLLT